MENSVCYFDGINTYLNTFILSFPQPLPSPELETNAVLLEQSGYVTEALRHLHAAQDAAASESRENARQLSVQQQVEREQ